MGHLREPEWGEANCMMDHIVYLANTSGLKIGITRTSQVPTAGWTRAHVQALPISGCRPRTSPAWWKLLFKEHINDRTNWRAMLKGEVEPLALAEERDRCSRPLPPASTKALQRTTGCRR